MMDVEIFPLVPNAILPAPAPATIRAQVPEGYGVQEQCLPFTAATALGFLIRSPITFGLCLPGDVPPGGHAFRSPVARAGEFDEARVFYVKDDSGCRFIKNAFTLDPVEITDSNGKRLFTPVQPGISFFDREDQQDLFKLHLPYIWRTQTEMDALFLPPINRTTPEFTVLAGLVETDWYANPVNLIFRKPDAGHFIHVAAGEPIAQVIFLMRSHRRPALKVIPTHARMARDLRASLVEWYQQQAKDRSAYKKLARSEHGRIDR
ncbi:MAG: DUF6065 family protein [Blastocatellia bacterium]